MRWRSDKWLVKKSRSGFRGYPVATVAYYGPDDQRATKAVIGIVSCEGGEVDPLERWYSGSVDIRDDPATVQEMIAFVRRQGARSIVMMDRLLGCPHEEGIDYPLGETCPQCPFWAGKDRWAD